MTELTQRAGNLRVMVSDGGGEVELALLVGDERRGRRNGTKAGDTMFPSPFTGL